jgi:cephalosporin-C deacetylase-like acetyl esterase
MLAVGWVTVGYYDNESTPTIYGVFNDKKQAIEWLAKLQSGHVQVVYAPSYNRG